MFPYAGGGPTAFGKWISDFPAHIEVRIAHYPGRGSRHNEAPIKDLAVLIGSIQFAIQPLLDKPFAFFGHSFGGLVAYVLTQSLRQNNLPQPKVLFISACSAPHIPDPNPSTHTLTDPEFVNALRKFNGIPSEIVNNPKIIELLLPTLRADFEAVESYQHDSSERPLSCPIVVFGGSNDPRVSQERMEGWASLTRSRFTSIYFPGDHFYINSVKDEIVQSITREMMNSPNKS